MRSLLQRKNPKLPWSGNFSNLGCYPPGVLGMGTDGNPVEIRFFFQHQSMIMWAEARPKLDDHAASYKILLFSWLGSPWFIGPMNQEVYPALKTNQHGFWLLLIFWLEPIRNFWSGSKFSPLRGRNFRHLFTSWVPRFKGRQFWSIATRSWSTQKMRSKWICIYLFGCTNLSWWNWWW